MKKFLVTIMGLVSAAVLLLAVNDWVNLTLIRLGENTTTYKMDRLFNHSHDGETAIFGSSRAATCFAPSELGTNVFNYGVSGSGMAETLLHVEAFCDRTTNGTVIVNIDPWRFGDAGEYYVSDYSLAHGSSLLRGRSGIKGRRFADWLPGLRFYGRLKNNLAAYGNLKMCVTQRIDCGANLNMNSRNEAEWEYIISKCGPQHFTLNEKAIAEFERVVREHPAIRVLLVVPPVSKPWWERFDGQQELQSVLARLGKLSGVEVFDMCTMNLERYDLSYFMDLTHLNEKGAKRFSKELAQLDK